MAHSLSSLQIDYTKIPPRSGLLEQSIAAEPERPGMARFARHIYFRPTECKRYTATQLQAGYIMKKRISTVALCAMLIGCSENTSITNPGTSESPNGIATLRISESAQDLRFTLGNNDSQQRASIKVPAGTSWVAEWDSREQLWICLDSERLMILNPNTNDDDPPGRANAGVHGPLDIDWPYCPTQFKHLQPKSDE